MITVNNLAINDDCDKILVDIEANTGVVFTKVLFWTTSTYPLEADAIDLTSLLAGSDNTEAFEIAATDVDLTYFNGLFFIEFTTDEEDGDCIVDCDTLLVPVGNFTTYKNCVLENLLTVSIKNCTLSLSSAKDCIADFDTLLFIESLIDSLFFAVKLYSFKEAIKMITAITELCDCCLCYDEEVNTLNLTGIKIIDGTITQY